MKIVCTADIHLGSSNHLGRINPETGRHTRLEDFLRNFDTIVDYAVDNRTDLLVIAGDIYKTRSPSNTEQEEFAKRVARLGEHGVRTIINTGNHDLWASKGAAHTVATIKALAPKGISIIDEPEIVDHNGYMIGVIPYLYRQRLGVRTNKETLERYQEKLDEFKGVDVKLLIGHQTIQNAVLPAGFVVPENLGEIIVPLDYFNGFDAAIFGHIHEYQVIKKDPLIIYTGPLERIDFGQAGKPVGFVVYDTNTKTHEFHELPAAELVSLKLDVTGEDDPTEMITSILKSKVNQQSIVSLKIRIKETDLAKLDRTAIQRILDTCKFSTGIKLDIERQNLPRNQEITEQMSPEQALKIYIENSPDLKDIADELIKRGTGIIKAFEIGRS